MNSVELSRAIGRLEGTLEEVKEDVKFIRDSYEPRIRKLEHWRWYVLGIIAAASAVVTGGFVLL